jgi:cell division protein FtsB
VARALLSAPELDALEALVRQHLRVVRRIEGLTEQAAQYDVMPAEQPELEAEAQRLRVQIKGTLETWLERLE